MAVIEHDHSIEAGLPAARSDQVWLPLGCGPRRRALHALLHGCESEHQDGAPSFPSTDGFFDHDLQLALWMYFTARNGGFVDSDADAVMSRAIEDAGWELREEFEARLLDEVDQPADGAGDLDALLGRLIGADPTQPTCEPSRVQTVRRFVAKAPYLAWEADAHSVALARLPDDLKQPFAEIQAGEYGVGHHDTHAAIYRGCLDALGVDLQTAIHVAPAAGFALANSAWFFALDHRYTGAALGQLSLFETDSVEPCRRQIAHWRRHGLPEEARRWYDVHVLADAEHGAIVTRHVLPVIEECHPELLRTFAIGAQLTAGIFEALETDALS